MHLSDFDGAIDFVIPVIHRFKLSKFGNLKFSCKIKSIYAHYITNKYNSVWEIIENSGIDFSKFGWGVKLSKLVGMTSQSTTRYVRKNYIRFYNDKCYIGEEIPKYMAMKILKEQKDNGGSINKLAKQFGYTTIAIHKLFNDSGIDVKLMNNSKKINMILDGIIVNKFDSVSLASAYVSNNLIGRKGKIGLDSAYINIARCINGSRSSSYGYKWEQYN